MKKFFIGCGALLLSFGLLLMILFLVYKSFTVADLKKRSDETNKIWKSFVTKENSKNNKIFKLLESYNFKNSDSLKIYLRKNLNISEELICNEDFVYVEFLLNKHFLMTFDQHKKNIDFLLDNKVVFETILDDIEEQNLIISKYDSKVRDYNAFISIFPNFIIAKQSGFKRKKYFQIKFGVENKNPKLVRHETIEWIKQIEKEQGL